MINVYTKEDYAKSYTELLEILKYISYEDVKKIPKEKLAYYNKNKDITHVYLYDPQLSFEEQPISKLTKILIANLYIEYWTTEEEYAQIKDNDKKELYSREIEKKKQYPVDDLFSNRRKTEKLASTVTSLTVIHEKGILARILYKIKKLFKLT